MARKASPTILQEELYPSGAGLFHGEAREELAREELDDARLVDLDVAEESPFLRGQKRVSARRSSLPRKTASRLLWAAVAAAFLSVGALASAALYRYGERSWRFRVESSDNIEVTGMQNVTKAQIMEVMGADIGRNIFFVPLAQQKAQLEQIPWVESASVMRFVPNRLEVKIHERTPIAFARVGPRIFLIDAGGTLMELPRQHKYSFPVILGMNPGEPLSTRAPRMKAYNNLIQDLDSGGARYSDELSEVDVSDLENLKVRVNDPTGDVLVQLGAADFLKRFKSDNSHLQEWRQQFQKLESVNLRYDNQVIVNPDMEGQPKRTPLTVAAAKAAEAAGVKPAALTTRIAQPRGLPKPAFELSKATLDSAAGKKPATNGKPKKTTGRHGMAASLPQNAKKSVRKNAPRQAAPRQVAKASSTPSIAVTRPVQQKSEVKRTEQPAASGAKTSPKPSPAIAKPQANASSD